MQRACPINCLLIRNPNSRLRLQPSKITCAPGPKLLVLQPSKIACAPAIQNYLCSGSTYLMFVSCVWRCTVYLKPRSVIFYLIQSLVAIDVKWSWFFEGAAAASSSVAWQAHDPPRLCFSETSSKINSVFETERGHPGVQFRGRHCRPSRRPHCRRSFSSSGKKTFERWYPDVFAAASGRR